MTSGPATVNEVLHAELSRLRPGLLDQHTAASDDDSQLARKENLQQIYKAIDSLQHTASAGRPERGRLAALCLSGGGIRSATFNLGVLQYLARVGLLPRFDYLSSVSGGGYVASWLRAWIHRSDLDTVTRQLGGRDSNRDPLQPEPDPVSKLRNYTNYLTPQRGLFSGDTWAAAALVARNLLLNWLVLIPLMAAAIAIPLIFLLVVRTPAFLAGMHRELLWIAIICETLASLCIYGFRRFAKAYPTGQGWFIAFCVLPVFLAAGMLSTAALGLSSSGQSAPPHPWCAQYEGLWGFSLLWCVLVPVVGWGATEIAAKRFPAYAQARLRESSDSNGQQRSTSSSLERSGAPHARIVPWSIELLALTFSGAVGALLLVGATRYWFCDLYNAPALYVICVLPLLLAIYLIARVLFVAFASVSERLVSLRKLPAGRTLSEFVFSEDADREWWARLSGWILLMLCVWIVVTALCLLGSDLLERLAHLSGNNGVMAGVKWLVGALGAVSGVVAALTGSSAKTPATTQSPNAMPPTTNAMLAIAGPLFVICILILLSWGVKAWGALLADTPDLFNFAYDLQRDPQPLQLATWRSFPVVIVGLIAVSFVAGLFINVNRFSLHGMYRNRLVRAYLGASNSTGGAGVTRIPDPFTGFAMSDNLPLHELCGTCADPRPLPIINTTLNLVNGKNLAWQQRKAASFSMTPLYCGSWSEGYRSSREYGGPGGLTLGTAMTISGAAVNPNMGYSSSPVLSFLMAMFNVRLGAWLGNTNRHGSRRNSYRRHGPRSALLPLLAEMFGLTNSSRSYVNLSDGGHFDNLGLYEVVLRRCRYVLVSDAGMDEEYSFKDLGNAIRKIRIDFGVDVVFERTIEISPNGQGKQRGLYCAVAKILYSQVDGTSPDHDGVLIYIKPSLRGRGRQVLPYDVYSYSRGSKTFPHESTVDQWFSESQFESYRALGFHILEQIARYPGGNHDCSFETFVELVTSYITLAPGSPLRAAAFGS